MTETNKKKISNALERAREKFLKAEEEERKLNSLIEKVLPEMDFSEISTKAENAENLEEAISCYVQYGEHNIEGIIEELESAESEKSNADL